MKINKGDKFVSKKKTFLMNKGDSINVNDVNKYGITFSYGENENCAVFMDTNTFENLFEKVEEKVKAPSITEEHIQNIIDNSEFEVFTVFDKCTLVVCMLPNGFIITESSACVSPENYDVEMGTEICFKKIVDKIWELEGYNLQNEVHKNNSKNADKKPVNADKKPVNTDKMPVVEDGCLDTDLDCYDCDDYGCHWNPNRHLNIT